MNTSPQLAGQVLERGTAVVVNFIKLANHWFRRYFSSYNVFLLHVEFISADSPSVGCNCIVQLGQQIIGVRRLRIHHIQPRGGNASPLQSLPQNCFVNHATPCGVIMIGVGFIRTNSAAHIMLRVSLSKAHVR